MPTKRLPTNANIDDLKRQADDLLESFNQRNAEALQRVREFHPGFSESSNENLPFEAFKPDDALLTIAHEYGYRSWDRLQTVVETQDQSENHRTHNDRISDPVFRHAVELLDQGSFADLKNHLSENPDLVAQSVEFEGDNYFTNPTLLEFVAENPIRKGRLPHNIADIAKLILEAGAKENHRAINETLGLVSTGRVTRECNVQDQLIDLLTSYGADPNLALQSAVAHGEFEAANSLIRKGAAPDLPSYAAMGDLENVLSFWPNRKKGDGQLSLALAAAHGRTHVVKFLLNAGVDPNSYNPPGGHSHCTALHSAAFAGHIETVQALVEGGARNDILDIHHGATAAQWAEHANQIKIASLIRSTIS